MNISYHGLELIEGPDDLIRDAIKTWFFNNGFDAKVPPHLQLQTAVCGSIFGITDNQTKRRMDVITKGVGKFTAVSVCHYTERIGPFPGVMFGQILNEEVDALFGFLRESFSCDMSSP